MKLLSPTSQKRVNEVIGLLLGYPGAWFADLLLQGLGIGAFVFPILLFGLAWKWVRSDELEAGAIKLCGTLLLLLSLTAAVSFAPRLTLYSGTIPIGGLLGLMLAHYLVHALNPTGAILLTITALIVSVYLVSTFTMSNTVSKLAVWFAGPLRILGALADALRLRPSRIPRHGKRRSQRPAFAQRAHWLTGCLRRTCSTRDRAAALTTSRS